MSSAPKPPKRIFTIGHSNRRIADFIAMLQVFAIETLADVRTIPRSRYNPQFAQEALAKSLSEAGIEYVHVKALGGMRKARADSPNTGWRNGGFRGYADYMMSEEFTRALKALLALAAEKRTAIMCAEAVPWRCHRSLIADALTVRGIAVENILSAEKATIHTLTPFAAVRGETLTYPSAQGVLI